VRHPAEYGAEHVSDRTSALALLLVALVVVEMASTLKEVFGGEEEEFELDIPHLAILRLLIVLSAILLIIALTAADVMWASERYAEAMAQFESKIRAGILLRSLASSSSYGAVEGEQVANLLKALSYRVHNFPVRISAGWFHLTPEWALGISILSATVLLSVVGIKLPGGE